MLIDLHDILIATKNGKSLIKIFTEVFERLVDNKLELINVEFLQCEIKNLVYVKSGVGVKPDSRGMQAVRAAAYRNGSLDTGRATWLPSCPTFFHSSTF